MELLQRLVIAEGVCEKFDPYLRQADDLAWQIQQLEEANNQKLSPLGTIAHLCGYGIPMLLRQKKKNERAGQIQQMTREREQLIQQARSIYAENYKKLEFLPQEYHKLEAVSYMVKMVNDDRADTLKEALALYDEYEHRRNMEMAAEQTYQQQVRNGAALDEMRRDIADIEWRTRWPFN